MTIGYEQFLNNKQFEVEPVGFIVDTDEINPKLFDWQRAITRWALSRGRAALFLDTGLGKTAIQLVWAEQILKRTGGRALILAPLAVSYQTAREAKKFGIKTQVTVCKVTDDLRDGINVTNYERLHYFEDEKFEAIVIDESSCLKAFAGKVRKQITDFAKSIKYRLACTATPAPNDLIELSNHSEYLGILSGKEIIALFFCTDGNTTHSWRLKGHATSDFWKWLSEWSIAIRKPSDLGYDDGAFLLPELRHHSTVVPSLPSEGELFPFEARGLLDRRRARRASMNKRVRVTADIVNDSSDTWVVWCDLNAESEALTKAIPGAVEVRGSHSHDWKEAAAAWFEGRICRCELTTTKTIQSYLHEHQCTCERAHEKRVLVSKSSIFGFGLNWQHCHKMAFVGLSDSFEQNYQATRRCWRFGQTQPVDCHVVTSEAEGSVVANIKRKEKQASEIYNQVVKHVTVHELHRKAKRDVMEYQKRKQGDTDWTMYLGDSCEVIKEIESDSVGLSIFSPPFPGLYAYSNSPRDIGNTTTIEAMIEHFDYLTPELLRVTKPGRMCCVHLMQLAAMLNRDGYIGLKDYRGAVIQHMIDKGWRYAGEATIDKNPQIQATRNKERGLLFKTLATDSSKLRMALADYLIYFRKDGENAEPILAGTSERYENGGGWITEKEWIEWAAPVWYRQTKDYPGGIRETDVLNVRCARESDDERHLCPLQLGVIERAVKLWSAPGDVVFSPYAGIGSEGYQSLLLQRKFVGIELKESYWKTACDNLRQASKEREYQNEDLFSRLASDGGQK